MPPARLRAVAPIVPAGRPLLSREFIDRYRREQVVAGVAKAAHEVGLLELMTSEVISAAGLGRAAFYGVFSSKPEALSYACREASAQIVAPVREARASSQPPAQRLAAGVEGFLAAVGEDPLLAELALIHTVAFEPDNAQLGSHLATTELAGLLEECRGSGGHERAALWELTACAIVAEVARAIKRGDLPPRLHVSWRSPGSET